MCTHTCNPWQLLLLFNIQHVFKYLFTHAFAYYFIFMNNTYFDGLLFIEIKN